MIFCSGCATVNVPNVGSKDYHLEDDEKRIINRSNEVIEAIQDAGYVYQDTALENYLNEIAQSLIPAEFKSDSDKNIRIQILRDPTLNAFAFANGHIFVHAGILAAADNEAQIATIFGHEMTHVYHRHTLKQFRSTKNSSAFWSTLGLTIDLVTGGLGSLLGQFSFLSSASGFSQQLEFEADEGGYQMIKTKGYDTKESVKLFERLAKFTEDEEIKEPFLFSSHPKVLERITKFNELNLTNPSAENSGHIGDPKFLPMTRQLKLNNIDMCFERGFYKTAERNIDIYVALYPDDVQGLFRRAELFRRRQDPLPKKKKREKNDDYKKAIETYEKTLSLDNHFANAWLGKARVLQKASNHNEAKFCFQKYLELEPHSPERTYIEQFLTMPSTENAK